MLTKEFYHSPLARQGRSGKLRSWFPEKEKQLVSQKNKKGNYLGSYLLFHTNLILRLSQHLQLEGRRGKADVQALPIL